MAFEIYLPGSASRRRGGCGLIGADRRSRSSGARAPGRTAFVAATARCASEIRLTYAELGQRVDKIAAGLIELGVGKGDIVAFQLPNWWEFRRCSSPATASARSPIR